MSAPARQVRARPAAKPRARTSPSLRVVPASRRRRKAPLLFWVAATVVVGAMVLGLAWTHVLIAQGAFEMDALTRQQTELAQVNGELRRDYRELSVPNRIAQEAQRLGLVWPGSIEIVRSHGLQAPRVPGGPE
jgi:hypothetical protein